MLVAGCSVDGLELGAVEEEEVEAVPSHHSEEVIMEQSEEIVEQPFDTSNIPQQEVIQYEEEMFPASPQSQVSHALDSPRTFVESLQSEEVGQAIQEIEHMIADSKKHAIEEVFIHFLIFI